MNLFLLIERFDYAESVVLGVYSSEDKAERARERYRYPTDVDIDTLVLDKDLFSTDQQESQKSSLPLKPLMLGKDVCFLDIDIDSLRVSGQSDSGL